MKKIFLTVSLLVSCFVLVNAQSFSNKGKDFWLAYPAHIDATASYLGLYITSDVNATGNVKVGTTNVPFTVTANQVTRIYLGTAGTFDANSNPVYLDQQDGIKSGAGIHVTADRNVVVYSHIIRSARSGATLALPVPVLGKDYIAPSYGNQGNQGGASSGFGEIAVIATEDNTTIEITPTATTRSGRPAGTAYTITLPLAGDAYQIQFQQNADLSGTKIKSIAAVGQACQPIAVFSATTWSAYDCGGSSSGGDNLYQQLFPTKTWGKSFLTAPLFQRAYDIYRVFVKNPATVVTRTVNGTSSVLTGLVGGSYYQFTSNQPNQIVADDVISVVQYMISSTCNQNNGGPAIGDPEMIILNPVEQTLNNLTFFAAHRNFAPSGQSNVTNNYVNIIIKNAAIPSVKINNANPVGSFVAIPGTNYSYLQEFLSNAGTNPVYNVKADSAFAAVAYGVGSVESYGYNAGTNVKDLYQYVTLQNQYATVDFPSTCKNSPFKFSITLPYLPSKLKWDFNQNPNLTPHDSVVNNAPVPDSQFVRDGRTLYVFRLTTPYIFSQSGTYPITVFANTQSASDGCNTGIEEIPWDVQVYDPPAADFTITQTGCLTDSVRFQDVSNAFGATVNRWTWNFGDGTSTTGRPNPAHLYTTPGTINIKETIITDIGCIADTTKTIVLTTPPIAKFGISNNTCKGQTVTFTDSSSIVAGTIVEWQWNIDNGAQIITNTTNASITQAFTIVGPHTVSLRVRSNSGCQSFAFIRNFTVHPTPVVDFTLPNVCLPVGAATFSSTSTISDGTQAAFGYLWNFGDGGTNNVTGNPTHLYGNNAGPFNVKLVVTSNNGCKDSLTKPLTTVYPQPIAAFNVQSELCLRETFVFTDQSTATNSTVNSWFWNFDDATTSNIQNPTHLYATPRSYNVKLAVRSAIGCVSDTLSKLVTLNPLPTANFNFSAPQCENTPVTFTDASTPNVGNLTKWSWHFGDGSAPVSTTTNTPQVHQYATINTYPVKLAVENSKGCKSDTITKNVVVSLLPRANMILPEVCLSDAFAQFTDSSWIPNNTALTYLWNFGDPNATGANPNTSTQTNPRHKYTAVGIYTITLTVTSSTGCATTITRSFTVNGSIPVANFAVNTPNSLCSNLPVSIVNSSTVDFGSITKIEVDFDTSTPGLDTTDQTPSTGSVYTFRYPNFQTPLTKTFNVRLAAYSGGTCVSVKIIPVTVNASPKTQFLTIPGICFEATPRQITQATQLGPIPGTFLYTGTAVNATGVFDPATAGVGTHTIKYLYTSNAGCKDSSSKSITVWPSPNAAFSISNPTCEKRGITFTDSSVANYSNITTWQWDFGDGTTQNRTNRNPFAKTYAAWNPYTVKLKVVTDSGCRSADQILSINVHPIPKVNFGIPQICLPSGTGTFTDSSTIADGTQLQFNWAWNFGDGGLSNIKNPVHQYASQGPFTISLKVTSNNGCDSTTSKVFNSILPQPKADFDVVAPNEVCLGGSFNFTDRSIGRTSSIASWHWSFDNGDSSAVQNPTKLYATARTYNVKLFIFNQQGCVSDTATKQVIVHPYPLVDAGPDLFVLEGGQGIFQPVVSGNDLRYLWTPNIYFVSSDTLKNAVIAPTDDQYYNLKVIARGGCSDTSGVFVKVLKTPRIPNAFSPNGDGINDTWDIPYLDTYPGAIIDIFNRYGQLVYHSVGYKRAWDGKINAGGDLPVGVYYYLIEPKNGRPAIKGSVTILR
jgi:gliding motility-associated-like protein